MQKVCKIFGIAALLLSAAVFCLACGSGNAPVAPPIDPPAQTPNEPLPTVPVYYTLRYNADKGGHILGETLQYVPENEIAGIVRAVPNTGYVFTGWSDGFPDAERIDLSVTDKTVTAQFRYAFDGQGTEQSPYLISSYQALQDMRQHPNAHYLLTQDLDMQGISHIPVFDDLIRFRGVFDGNGHTVKNLTIDTDEDFPSLFGFSDGDIFNLRATDFSITVPDLYLNHPISVGAVCAVANGNLSDVHVSGSIQSNKLCPSYRAIIGGLVGTTFGTVQNCTANVQIHIDDDLPTNTVGAMGLINVGGLIGWTYGDVLSCRSSGKISWTSDITTSGGVRFVAGLVGVSSHSDITDTMTVSDCTSSVSIQTDCNVSCGGLLGYFYMPNTAILIKNCNASGNIQIDNAESGTAGGFACDLTLGVNSVVQNCHSSGNVSAGSANGFVNNIFSAYIGSVIIQNCYSTGNMYGKSHANGFSDDLTDVLAVNCHSVSQVMTVNGTGTATGFSNSLSGTIRNCYAICDVTGARSCGFSLHTSGTIQECYSSGTVYSMKAATAFIFTVFSGTVINCYSSSDIVMTNENINTAILASGLAEVNNGSVLNCYFSGKILGTTTKTNSIIGTLVGINRGTVRNCHWLYHEDSLAQKAISRNYGTDETIYRYEKKADMYFIADLLNDNTQDVWVNVDSDTPTFKTIL